jgi:hypothetical protein
LSPEAAQHAIEPGTGAQFVISSQFSTFVADWITVNVRQEQINISTVDEARDLELRDFAGGLMNLLPETPIDALGINYLAHFRVQTMQKWHDFGDRFLPKKAWDELIPEGEWIERDDGTKVGLRAMVVEIHRNESQVGGYLRVDVAPSVRVIPYGVFVEINSHYAVPKLDGLRGTAGEYAQILEGEWSGVRELQSEIVERIERLL